MDQGGRQTLTRRPRHHEQSRGALLVVSRQQRLTTLCSYSLKKATDVAEMSLMFRYVISVVFSINRQQLLTDRV